MSHFADTTEMGLWPEAPELCNRTRRGRRPRPQADRQCNFIGSKGMSASQSDMRSTIAFEHAARAEKRRILAMLRNAFDARGRFVLALAVIAVGWVGRDARNISAEHGIGYFLGIVSVLCMLVLLVYPLRKRFRRFKFLGSTRDWFRTHMMMGAGATLTALYHCNFTLGSMNSRIALFSLLLIAASGLVGRFIYQKIHHGLNGRKRSFKKQLSRVKLTPPAGGTVVTFIPDLMDQVKVFDQAVLVPPRSLYDSLRLPFVLNAKTRIAHRRLLRFARRRLAIESAASSLVAQHADRLDNSIDKFLRTHLRQVRRVAEFLAYERLFSLWHRVHIPFFILLVISVFVHIVAVHWY